MSIWYSVTVPTLEFDYLYTYYINFLFSPVTVSFYISSMAKLRFVNCCTNKRIWMNNQRKVWSPHIETLPVLRSNEVRPQISGEGAWCSQWRRQKEEVGWALASVRQPNAEGVRSEAPARAPKARGSRRRGGRVWGPKSILVHFAIKIWPLVPTISINFLLVNRSNFVQ